MGVEDGGKLVGLSDEELESSVSTLSQMADALQANMVIVSFCCCYIFFLFKSLCAVD